MVAGAVAMPGPVVVPNRATVRATHTRTSAASDGAPAGPHGRPSRVVGGVITVGGELVR